MSLGIILLHECKRRSWRFRRGKILKSHSKLHEERLHNLSLVTDDLKMKVTFIYNLYITYIFETILDNYKISYFH